MTSEPTEAYVWVWLPDSNAPVVAGLLEAEGEIVEFTYGRSYLDRPDAIPLHLPELPLRADRLRPPRGMRVARCIVDAGPDAWGRRVIEARRGPCGNDVGLLGYLLEGGSDRIGALDFQADPRRYASRWTTVPLEEMVDAATRLDAGLSLPADLDAALLHGSSIGGDRPKFLVDDGERKLIAKLSSSADVHPVVKAEAVAMELGRRAGLDVAGVELTECMGRDVLLVERFDRPGGATRRMVVSAHTVLGLDTAAAGLATYPGLAVEIRRRFTAPHATLGELFARIVFNVCVSNTDDHARNHAAFWDGRMLTLTPAYDICPQLRGSGPAEQALAIAVNGDRRARLGGCIAAAGAYHLRPSEAADIVERCVGRSVRSGTTRPTGAVSARLIAPVCGNARCSTRTSSSQTEPGGVGIPDRGRLRRTRRSGGGAPSPLGSGRYPRVAGRTSRTAGPGFVPLAVSPGASRLSAPVA